MHISEKPEGNVAITFCEALLAAEFEAAENMLTVAASHRWDKAVLASSWQGLTEELSGNIEVLTRYMNEVYADSDGTMVAVPLSSESGSQSLIVGVDPSLKVFDIEWG